MSKIGVQYVGVIGSGSFGTTIAKLLIHHNHVLIYTRTESTANTINETHTHMGVNLGPNIRATTKLEDIASECRIIFPVIPSANLREMMRKLGHYLRPRHILIHCIKGFDLPDGELDGEIHHLSRKEVRTMSEVIREESNVLRIGCLAGPNLAKEILDGQPTATVVASEFDEVIQIGQKLLSSPNFFVFGSHDIIGAEIAGALKNVVALGSGLLAGRGLGKNMQAMLITRGLHEMIYFGSALGAQKEAFLGTAGIGDLIATSTSTDSRNFSFGWRLGQGEKIEKIEQTVDEVAEGIRTLKIAYLLADYYDIKVPITEMLFKVIYENFAFKKALEYLMRYPYRRDVDFL